jgi:hypothetical protein
MENLTDVYNQFASIDDELEKQASEMVKQAEEEQFAGLIMARGFADEMNKLAGDGVVDMGKGKTIPSKSYAQANANSGKHNISGSKDNVAVNMSRTSQGPITRGRPVKQQVAANAFGAKKGRSAGPSVSTGNRRVANNVAPAAGPKAGSLTAGLGIGKGVGARVKSPQSVAMAPKKETNFGFGGGGGKLKPMPAARRPNLGQRNVGGGSLAQMKTPGAAKPAVASALGKVTGGLNLSSKMPTLPGAKPPATRIASK